MGGIGAAKSNTGFLAWASERNKPKKGLFPIIEVSSKPKFGI